MIQMTQPTRSFDVRILAEHKITGCRRTILEGYRMPASADRWHHEVFQRALRDFQDNPAFVAYRAIAINISPKPDPKPDPAP